MRVLHSAATGIKRIAVLVTHEHARCCRCCMCVERGFQGVPPLPCAICDTDSICADARS